MWLPHRIYEAVPTVCMVAGATMLAGALYIGFDSLFGVVYFLVALTCTIYGAGIAWLRYRYRRPGSDKFTEAPTADEMAARRFH